MEERLQWKRKQQKARLKNKRKQRELAKNLRLCERKPFFKRTKFKPDKYDIDKFYSINKQVQNEELAQDLYDKSVRPNANTFWWEAVFDHERYVTRKGKEVLKAKKDKEERETRETFKAFLATVPVEQHKNLQGWADDLSSTIDFSGYGNSDSDLDINEFLDEDEIAWEHNLDFDTIKSILYLSKNWEPNKIPIFVEDTWQNVSQKETVEEDITYEGF